MKRPKKNAKKPTKATKSKPKAKANSEPKPTRPAAEPDFELDHVGEWTDEHTKVIARLLVDLEEAK